jgi:acetoin utilization protein AcuB
MRIRDVMTRTVETITAAAPAHAAIGRMLTRKVRHLPVVDQLGSLVGVVTDRDLRHYLFSPGVFERIGQISSDELLKAVPVKQIMSSPAISVRADDHLETAARLMVERKIGSLPVVEGERVVGIITETDLLRRIVITEEARTPECEAIVVSFP